MASTLSLLCHAPECAARVELPDDGRGRIPLEPLRGWHFGDETNWLCPDHKPTSQGIDTGGER